MDPLDHAVSILRAAAEPTRLRLLALCAEDELTVSELTEILGQSQPRVSRHLKLLCDCGLLDRFQERTSVFYRLTDAADLMGLTEATLELLPDDDSTRMLDRERLVEVQHERELRAASRLRETSARWEAIRALYVPEHEVEAALLTAFENRSLDDFLDIGTGTGRVLELFGPRIRRGIGIDLSHPMLEMARVNLVKAGFKHCHVRHSDMSKLQFATASFDGVVIHMALHYASEPLAVLTEAARVLRPGGRLVLVDFAPHELEILRTNHDHSCLGFAETDVADWLSQIGLRPATPIRLPGRSLTVVLWPADSVDAVSMAPDGEPQLNAEPA